MPRSDTSKRHTAPYCLLYRTGVVGACREDAKQSHGGKLPSSVMDVRPRDLDTYLPYYVSTWAVVGLPVGRQLENRKGEARTCLSIGRVLEVMTLGNVEVFQCYYYNLDFFFIHWYLVAYCVVDCTKKRPECAWQSAWRSGWADIIHLP